MMDNLLDMAVRQLGSVGIGALNSALGLPEGKGESALNAGLATTIAGMLHRAEGHSGLGSLLNMVTGAGGLDLSSAADIFGDPSQMASLQKSGGKLLEGILESRQIGVINAFSSALGLSNSAGGGLLKVAAPMVMSLLGKMAKSKGMDIGDLASLLVGQKPFIQDKLPGSMLQELGVTNFDKLGEGARAFSRGHAEPQAARTAAEKKRGGWGKWLWPPLIVLGALYALNMCANREQVEKQLDVIDEEPVVEPGVEAPKPVVPDTSVSDFGTSFREYLASAARDPNREFPLHIQFPTDGSTPTAASFPDVQALVAILQENAALTIAIEGHTDSEGDAAANQQLSEQRAQAVRQMLVDAGIDGNRVTATGMGSTKPIADNDTEEGRAQNRRISVRVVNFE